MIVWFNNKISDIRVRKDPRFNLRHDNRLDIAKYTYASYAPLAPLVSKFIFTCETADGFAGRDAELEDFLRSVFPADKLDIRPVQITKIDQWYRMVEEFEEGTDDLIYPAGNEDLVFLDSNIEIFRKALDILNQDPDPRAQFMTSDYSVFIRANQRLGGQLTKCRNFVKFNMNNSDSMRVVKRSWLRWLLNQTPSTNEKLIRTESWNQFGFLPEVKLYAATKEQCRHFDGYSHMHMNPATSPPLEIPVNFFNGMTIRYGFKDVDRDCVNINPLAETEKVTDLENGVDYRFTLDDIPAFWKPFIKEIKVSNDIDHEQMARARDRHMLAATRAEFDFTYLGYFSGEPYTPADWINNHTLIEKF